MFKKLGLAIVGASILVWGFFVQPQVANANSPSVVNADVSTNKEEWEKFSVLLNKLSQWLYAMSWPMLVLAGTFTDNDVIYGTFIGLDKSLWGIWNIMRTFANFFIWFLFIVAILSYFWGIKKDQLNPMKILPQMVLASILVNTSWFIIWTLLDISTIATYAVGLLPMKVDDTVKDIAIPKVTITLTPTNSDSKFKVQLCDKYEPCVFNSKGLETSKEPCYYLGESKENPDTIEYKVLNEGETPLEWSPMNKNCLISKETMLDNMKNLTGPFVAIFQSLMDSSQVAKNEASMKATTNASITIMKAMFLIALLVPLITLCIILIVRAILLWMIIIFSPLLFLFTAITWFKWFVSDKKSLSAVVNLIFLPVFVTFALSLSLVFMNALQKSKIATDIEWPKLLSQFGCDATDANNMTCTIKDGTDIEIELAQNDKAAGGLLKDLGKWIWRIISNLFGIWFMWVIVFAALKSSKITAGIASSIESFSTSMAKAAPLIPIGGAGMQSISSLGKWMSQIKDMPRQRQTQQYREHLEKPMEEFTNDAVGLDTKLSWEANKKAESLEALDKDDVDVSKIGAEEKWATFDKLTSEQKTNMTNSLEGTGISHTAIDKVSQNEEFKWKSFNSFGWDIQEALAEEQNKINLRNFLRESFLDKNISLFQAAKIHSEIWDKFDIMYRSCWFKDITITDDLVNLARKGIHKVETHTDVVWLMKIFYKIWIRDKDDMFKLLVPDLISDEIREKDKTVLDSLYDDSKIDDEE